MYRKNFQKKNYRKIYRKKFIEKISRKKLYEKISRNKFIKKITENFQKKLKNCFLSFPARIKCTQIFLERARFI